MLFPLFFVAVFLSHLTLLRLPYYWDEAGYYIPAAYDFLRTGSLIPSSTLSNAHPPLPSLYLALWWKTSGFTPMITRTSMCLLTALALLAVYRLAMGLTSRPQTAAATVLLTAIYPVWFAQSTLAHADLFAAAATLWALAFAITRSESDPPDRPWAAVLCFSLAALSKETAIVTPLSLALWEAWLAWRNPTLRRRHLTTTLQWLLPIFPLALWYAYHRYRTGYIFGNPEYLRYNATSTLTPLRILPAFGHRAMHIVAHMNMFVPVLCMVAAMMLVPLPESDGRLRPRVPWAAQAQIYIVILANLVFFSVLGGALLTRYLLPLYPLVLLLCVNTWRRRVRYWQGLVLLSAFAFLAGLFVNPPYRFAPEDNLAYRDVIVLHQQAIHQLLHHYPNATVLTAWPASDELSKPELGYVRRPVPVVRIENFSLDEIQKAAQSTEPFTTGLIFSTKYDPPHLPFSLGPRNEALDSKFFDFHHDLPPDAISRLLGGEVSWQAERKGQWAAVLHFNRAQAATLRQP
jgi:4-amino-4-deoxy-L-arabinose transferase-like glycosyltransferase